MFDIQENLLSWVIFLPIAGIGILLALEATAEAAREALAVSA